MTGDPWSARSAGSSLEARLRAAIAAERKVVAESLSGALRARDRAREVVADLSRAGAGPHGRAAEVEAAAAYETSAEHVHLLQHHLRDLLGSEEVQRRIGRTPRVLGLSAPGPG